MHVLFLINGLGGSGGAERSLLENLPYYTEQGVRTTVAVLKEKPEGEREAAERGAEVVRLPGDSLRTWACSFRHLVAERRPDLLYTSLWDADLIGRLGRIGRPVPLISSLVNTPDDPTGLEDRTTPTYKRRLAEAIDRYTGKLWTTHYHAVAAAVRDAYVRDYGIPAEKITVVPRGRSRERLGVASPERRQATRDRLGIAYESPLLVNVGRHESQKDQRTFVAAVARMRSDHPALQAVILGREGAMTEKLRGQIEQNGLEDCVHLLGYREDVADIVAASDVFVFPSLREGAAGALLEAMALARPIVAADIPALREPITPGRNGELVPPGNAGAFAAAIDRMLNDPAGAEAMGAAAAGHFEANYTIARSSELMVELFGRVTNRGRASRGIS